MSIIQAAGSGEVSTGFYKLLLDQSLKFDDGDAQYLTRTNSGAASSTTLTVLSCWVKRCTLGSIQMIFTAATTAPNVCGGVYFTASDQIAVYLDKTAAGSDELTTITTSVFRDVSAWYHVVIVYNTADSTTANKSKIYVNGVQQPVTTSTTGSAVTTQRLLADGVVLTIGKYFNDSYYLDGYLAEYHVVDGVAGIDHDDFGETKDGIWVAKSYSGGHGNNGFHLTFKDDVVSEGFNTVTYAGTAGKQSISGIGFQPDFVWIKSRTSTGGNVLQDSVRGSFRYISSNGTDDANTTSGNDWFRSFDGDGFTVSNTNTGGAATSEWNASGQNYVGWCWEAGGTPTADNSAGVGNTPTAGSVKIDGSNLGSALGGSIAATRISANTAKGFSITTYTGTGGTKTVAHGLGATPAWVMTKVLDTQPTYWRVWHTGVTSGQNLLLNDGAADSAYANRIGTNHTTSVVELIDGTSSDDNVNDSGGSYVMYSWTDITGYSKFGSYTGNADANGPSVTLGFEPAWLLIKNRDASENWYIWDNTREPAPAQKNKRLHPNLNVIEQTSTGRSVTFTSTGFQVTGADSSVNGDGNTLIYAAFADTRSAAFFKDVSTNGNHFTPVNLDYRDSVPDVPTNNFATLNSLALGADGTLSDGNLKIVYGTSSTRSITTATMGVSSGKWYWEVLPNIDGGEVIGITNVSNDTGLYPGVATGSAGYYGDDGSKYVDGSNSSYGASFATDIIGFALDMDAGTLVAYKNNSSQGTLVSSLTGNIFPAIGDGGAGGTSSNTFNFGQDSSFGGLHATANSNADSKGHGSFAYAPPSGFLALCSQNLSDPDIIDGTDNFNTVLYTGNDTGSRAISGVGFLPDWLWIKNRTSSNSHALFDSLRGSGSNGFYRLATNLDTEEQDPTNVASLNADGFTLGSNTGTNGSGKSFVAWNWKINAGTESNVSAGGSSNIRLIGGGTADQAAVQANTTAGISIVGFENTVRAADGFCTFPHGLGSAPDMVWLKSRTSDNYWAIYHSALGLKLGFLGSSIGSNAFISSTFWNAVSASTVKFQSNGNIAATDEDIVAYCFKNIEGYSKAGSYLGSGAADGPFIFTGFRPAFLLIKNSETGESWQLIDSTRSPHNVSNNVIYPNAAAEESAALAAANTDLLSNGFKIRAASGNTNDSGEIYIYLAFAESPFKFANAR